jgi:hypothetical protein
MDPNVQQAVMLAAVKSMVIEVGERLGDDNPWSQIGFDAWDAHDLAGVKKLLHELLYAPSSRR